MKKKLGIIALISLFVISLSSCEQELAINDLSSSQLTQQKGAIDDNATKTSNQTTPSNDDEKLGEISSVSFIEESKTIT